MQQQASLKDQVKVKVKVVALCFHSPVFKSQFQKAQIGPSPISISSKPLPLLKYTLLTTLLDFISTFYPQEFVSYHCLFARPQTNFSPTSLTCQTCLLALSLPFVVRCAFHFLNQHTSIDELDCSLQPTTTRRCFVDNIVHLFQNGVSTLRRQL